MCQEKSCSDLRKDFWYVEITRKSKSSTWQKVLNIFIYQVRHSYLFNYMLCLTTLIYFDALQTMDTIK